MSSSRPCSKCGAACFGTTCKRCLNPQRYCKGCGVHLTHKTASNQCTHCLERFPRRKCAKCKVEGPGTTREIRAKGWKGAIGVEVNAHGKLRHPAVWLCPGCYTPENLVAAVTERMREAGAG